MYKFVKSFKSPSNNNNNNKSATNETNSSDQTNINLLLSESSNNQTTNEQEKEKTSSVDLNQSSLTYTLSSSKLNQQSFDDNSDRKSRSKLVHQDNGGGRGGRDPLVKIMLNDSIQIDDDDNNDDYINRNLKG